MEILTVRNLDPTVKAKLKERAAKHGRSMEAEARAILTTAVDEREPLTLVDSIRRHFGHDPLTLPPREQADEAQRSVEFGS
ncbi:FitA-like ribbon-helix-helix domain-containing protein [Humibacter sp.]|uniref:FitA-like ribbon-helix-helix domain-containing protein n=1 Tax=Humibacter sp. TaxID=1940291 RepID=UPI003F817C10